MRRVWVAVLVAVFMMIGVTAPQAADYPSKPVEMLVGYKAGGLVDTMARALAKPMEEALGQPVVILNKPGAGGALAVTSLKGAKPDGYTIGITTALTFTYTPYVQKVDFGLDDYTFVGSVGRFQEAFVSAPDKPWKDFKGLVEYSKKNPGLAFATMHPIGGDILQYIAKKEGIQWREIPTKGGEEVMTAILGNHVDFGFSGGIHTSFVKAGKMIVLAGLGKERLLASPDVPTLTEFGYGVTFVNDNIIAVPKGLPDPVKAKLASAVEKAAKDPGYIDLLQNKLVIPAVYVGGEELTGMLREYAEFQKNLVKALQK